MGRLYANNPWVEDVITYASYYDDILVMDELKAEFGLAESNNKVERGNSGPKI